MTTELLFRDDAYRRSAQGRVIAVSERGIELDCTVFYPLGGGQAGDAGVLRRSSGEAIVIADTRKGEGPERVLHVPAAGSAVPALGEVLELEIDWPRRHCLMRLHT